MNVPEGFTEQQVIDLITKIIERMASRYTFGYYDVEDIKQEAFIIAIDGLKRYDNDKGPLENFLSVHIKNRLLTLRRNKFYRKDKKSTAMLEKRNESKKNLMEPIDISKVRDEDEKNMKFESDILDILVTEEIFTLIDKHLNIHTRLDYLKMLDGVAIPAHRRNKVEQEIIEILRENGYD